MGILVAGPCNGIVMEKEKGVRALFLIGAPFIPRAPGKGL
jgi:hypothetical protein